jgi:transcriptional regulator with XRE-family HTH domain
MREDRGYSLRQLEGLTGISDSEIYKIEAGHQRCQLDALETLCNTLGVTHGWILDRSLQADTASFKMALSVEAQIEDLWKRIQVVDKSLQRRLIDTLAVASSRAAILVMSSNARSLVESDDFPHREWREKFAGFAETLDSMGGDCIEKAGSLQNLAVVPYREMSRLQLIADKALYEEAVNYTLPRRERKDFTWEKQIPLRVPAYGKKEGGGQK